MMPNPPGFPILTRGFPVPVTAGQVLAKGGPGQIRGTVSDAARRQLCGKADYHRTELVSEQYDYDGQLVTVQMYRRPVSAIFRQLLGAGFTVDVVDEPQPEMAGEPSDPEVIHILQTQPVFLFIRALRA
jgi:hypothetical protein